MFITINCHTRLRVNFLYKCSVNKEHSALVGRACCVVYLFSMHDTTYYNILGPELLCQAWLGEVYKPDHAEIII